MLSEPKIEQRPAMHTVGIRRRVEMGQFGEVMSPMLGQLMGWMAQHGVAMKAGTAPYFRYLRVYGNMESLDTEAGVVVDSPVAVDGDIVADVVPAARYVTAQYTGTYHGLADANAQVMQWAREHQIEFAVTPQPDGALLGGNFEFYITDPRETPEPNDYVTELAFMIRG